MYRGGCRDRNCKTLTIELGNNGWISRPLKISQSFTRKNMLFIDRDLLFCMFGSVSNCMTGFDSRME